MRRLFLFAAAVVVITILLPFLVSAQGTGPGRSTEITISGDLKTGQAPAIHPPNIYLDRGAQAVWANGSDTPVRVKFGSGESCKEVTQSELIRYRWSELDCIITPVIPPKKTFEMYPTDPGAIPWQIEFVGADKKLSGELKVF